MAIAFELVIDFLDNRQQAEICCSWLTARASEITIDGYRIAIHAPFVSSYPYERPTHFQVIVLPANVGVCVALDDGTDRIPLNGLQLSRLGHHLFDLIRGTPHFKMAMVGWDVDFLLNINDLKNDRATEIRDGSFDGLVVENSLVEQLPHSDFFVPFDDHHQWIPYVGSEAMEP